MSWEYFNLLTLPSFHSLHQSCSIHRFQLFFKDSILRGKKCSPIYLVSENCTAFPNYWVAPHTHTHTHTHTLVCRYFFTNTNVPIRVVPIRVPSTGHIELFNCLQRSSWVIWNRIAVYYIGILDE